MLPPVRFHRVLPILPALALLAAVPIVTLAPSVKADANRSPTMDVDAIQVGMKGYGLTVFKGTAPEKFDVEVVGILHKFRPNQDLVLIKTPHERLNIAHTVAGMSGSPIFLDGKMIGAYAYGWQFGSEPIAGVTPIKNMLEDLARPVPPNLLLPMPIAPPPHDGAPRKTGVGPRRPRRAANDQSNGFEGAIDGYDLRNHARQVGERAAGSLSAPVGTKLAKASTMVTLAGMGERSARAAADLLSPLGFETVQAGGASAGPSAANDSLTYVDGGAVGVQLIRGDISAMGLGTVTRVEGDKLVAFGHPMQHGGITSLPTAVGRIHWILASQMRSFKIGEPARPLGSLINDLQASIVVDSKAQATTFPVTVQVEGVEGAPKKSWSLEIAHDRFLSPTFVGVAMGNTVESTVSERRDATWEARTKITVKGYGTIETHDFGLAIGGTPNADDFVRSRATRAVGMILNNPWEFAQVEKVEMSMKITFSRDLWSIRGAKLLEDTIDPGQKARVQLRLTQFSGPDEVRTIEVEIPKSFAGREVDIALVPGWQDAPELPAPESLATLLANIPRQSFAPNTLLAVYRLPEAGVTFKGQMAARLPAGAIDMIKTQGDSDSPSVIPVMVRTPFPMGRFIDGRDHVRVRVRENLR
jgi:hypothetical protein